MSIPEWVCRAGVGITGMSKIHAWIARPAAYLKSKQYFFLTNLCTVKTHLQAPGGFPVQFKNYSWYKTECYNVLSDFFIMSLQRHLAAVYAGSRRRRRILDWASESWRKSLLFINPTCLWIFILITKNLLWLIFHNLWFKLFSSNSNYIIKNAYKTFKRNIFTFLDIQVSVDQN